MEEGFRGAGTTSVFVGACMRNLDSDKGRGGPPKEELQPENLPPPSVQIPGYPTGKRSMAAQRRCSAWQRAAPPVNSLAE